MSSRALSNQVETSLVQPSQVGPGPSDSSRAGPIQFESGRANPIRVEPYRAEPNEAGSPGRNVAGVVQVVAPGNDVQISDVIAR